LILENLLYIDMAAMNDMCVIIEHDKKKKQVRELNVSETQRIGNFY